MTRLSLGERLALGFLIVAILPLTGLAWFYLHTFETALTQTVLQSMVSIAEKKADQIDTYINERLADTHSLAGQPQVREALTALADEFHGGGLVRTTDTASRFSALLHALGETANYHDVLLIDADGHIVFSLIGESDLGTNLLHGPYRDTQLAAGFSRAMTSLHSDFSHFAPYAPSDGAIAAFTIAPILDAGRPLGALALQVNLATLMPVVLDRTGLGDSGETVLAMRDGADVRYTVALTRKPGQPFEQSVPFTATAAPMRLALSGQHGQGITQDYAGVAVVASWHYLPALDWGMVVKIDVEEALAPLHATQRTTLFAFVVFLGVSIGTARFLGHHFVRAEMAVARSHDQLSEAQRIAHLGHWTLDHRRGHLEWSEEIYRIFEIEPDRFPADYATFIATVHPDDRERVDREFKDSVAMRTPYSLSHRILLADGRVKHVHEHGETTYASDGTPLISHGTVQDITELRRAEEALQLYANIFEHSGEAILVTDHDNRIIAINPAFTRQTCYGLDDVIGLNPSLLSAGRTPRETYIEMWKSLETVGYWQGELWDRNRNGSVYPKWAAISAIRDAQGRVTHYIAGFTDISERKAAEQRIEHLAHHDSLTGLFNRYNLEIRLSQALASAHRDGNGVAVLFIDLDRFKVINDTLGHHVGDLLLIEVAERLRDSVRESDIVARLGGDEFVVALTGLGDPGEVSPVAAKILARLAEPYRIADDWLHTSPSIGISVYPEDGTDPETLMKNADAAMYHAKEQGRNNLQYFTAELNAAAADRLILERELRRAIAEGQLDLHFQPQVATTAKPGARPIGMEVLIRWHHPALGLIPPQRFIPVAEETGLIHPIGHWVLDQACRRFARWKAADIGPRRIAVNLSVHQLRDPDLPDQVAAIMRAHGIEHDELELEITETATMSDPERSVKILHALRTLGVSLAIDDFGTGYSSLAYLKRLPIQTLKLDQDLTRDIETDENDAAISAATLALAQSLRLRVVAEGVETEGQRRFLEQHGCDLLQGFLCGPPAPAAVWEARWRADDRTHPDRTEQLSTE